MPKKIVEFRTEMAATNLLVGSKGGQFVQFVFMSSDNIWYSTIIGPKLSAEILSQLRSSLESLPDPYTIHPTLPELMGTQIPGKSKHAKATVTYFGQAYDPDILEVLGVLMVRVNLLENNLSHLLSVVAPMDLRQAEAALASTTNMRAKRDLILALLPNSGLAEAEQKEVRDSLLMAKNVSDRRNTLYHAQWTFKNDKFEIQRYQPNTTRPRSSSVETKKSILQLATDFREAGMAIESIARQIRAIRGGE